MSRRRLAIHLALLLALIASAVLSYELLRGHTGSPSVFGAVVFRSGA